MTFSESFCAGFALAATIAKDAGAEQARAGLCEASAATLTGAAHELRALSKAERRARVSTWIRANAGPRAALTLNAVVWPRVPSSPLRAYALLAQRLGADAAAPAWLRELSELRPRAGYTPDPQLIEQLQRSLQKQGASWDE
jgi:hypothetical protein